MNVINIATGLLDKHEQIKDSDPTLAAEVKAELAAIAPGVREAVSELRGLIDPATIDTEDGRTIPSVAAAEIRLTGRRLDDLLDGGKRNAKAATAPNKTTA